MVTIGHTVLAKGGFQVHRYASAFEITDLTNAGKRGKKVDRCSLYDVDDIRAPEHMEMIEGFAAQITEWPSYELAAYACKVMIEALQDAGATRLPKFCTHTLRGVDVAPATFAKITIDTDELTLEADYLEFSIMDKRDTNNLPALISGTRSDRTEVKRFYEYVKANAETLRGMAFREVEILLHEKLGIYPHSYCRMD